MYDGIIHSITLIIRLEIVIIYILNTPHIIMATSSSSTALSTRRLVEVGECVPFSQKLAFVDEYDESTSRVPVCCILFRFSFI